MNSHKTAIHRKGLSVPMRWLLLHNKLKPGMLDYGCGLGSDARNLNLIHNMNCKNYDPSFYPCKGHGKHPVVTCLYVLNTLPHGADRLAVIRGVMRKVEKSGRAYFAIRGDKKNLKGKTSRGTWQGYVARTCRMAGMTRIHKTGHYEIWELVKQ